MTLVSKNSTDGGALVVSNAAVLTTAQSNVDVDVSGSRSFTVVWRLKGTVTTGDLATPTVRPYYPDGATLINQALTAASSVASAVGGADVWASATYDTRGVQKVQVRATNSNAGTLNIDVIVFQTS